MQVKITLNIFFSLIIKTFFPETSQNSEIKVLQIQVTSDQLLAGAPNGLPVMFKKRYFSKYSSLLHEKKNGSYNYVKSTPIEKAFLTLSCCLRCISQSTIELQSFQISYHSTNFLFCALIKSERMWSSHCQNLDL